MNVTIDITNIVLKTERLTLRTFQYDDLDDFFEYASVEGVGEMAGWQHHPNKEFTKIILNAFMSGKHTFAIVKENKVIGSIGVEKYDESLFPLLDDQKGCKLGFVLGKPYWGQGIMKEAVEQIMEWLFEQQHLDFINCGHFLDNLQSKRVQEKLGFHFYCYGNYTCSDGSKLMTIENILTYEDWKNSHNLIEKTDNGII